MAHVESSVRVIRRGERRLRHVSRVLVERGDACRAGLPRASQRADACTHAHAWAYLRQASREPLTNITVPGMRLPGTVAAVSEKYGGLISTPGKGLFVESLQLPTASSADAGG